jgi:DNA polymerase-3 subunit gamma/tau
MLGAVDRSHAVRCIEAAAARDGAARAAVDGLRSLGLSAPGALEEMAALLQEMAVVQAVPDALAGDDPDAEVVVRLAALVPADEPSCSTAWSSPAAPAGARARQYGLVMVLLRMLAFAPADERAAATSPPTPASPRTAAPARRQRRKRRRHQR